MVTLTRGGREVKPGRPVVATGKARGPRLSRERWVDAALTLLAEGGRGAVQVEPLARRLRVTKGSFYWHFRDLGELLDASLRRWEDVETLAIKERVEAGGGTAVERLRRLFTIALGRRAVALEVALRQWAGSDRRARAAVARVDRRRLGYLSALFAEACLAAEEAQARGFLAYAVLFGDFFIRLPGARATRADLLERSTAFLLADVAGGRSSSGRLPG